MNRTDEWLTIETLIAGLSEMARDIKEMEDGSSHMSDENCKQAENTKEAADKREAELKDVDMSKFTSDKRLKCSYPESSKTGRKING